MPKPNIILFLCADETHFCGERDYMKALALEIRGRELEDTEYIVCKTPFVEGGTAPYKAGNLPVTDAEYAAVPHLNAKIVERLNNKIMRAQSASIIGVGHSTLPDVTMLSWFHNALSFIGEKAAGLAHKEIHTAYITHMVESIDDLRDIADVGITLFAPVSCGQLAAMDAAAGKVDLLQLETVPHTNSTASCQMEYERYIRTPVGAEVRRLVESHENFAFAIVNAGFPIDDRRVCYTENEAFAHGDALARAMPAGTHLILAHGGPRNLDDEKDGQKTMEAFARGYGANSKGRIFQERFTPGGYNIVKVGYIMSAATNCHAFISSAEGYGTMNGAIQHVDNTDKLLGMFPFQALDADPTGQMKVNLYKAHQSGVSLLSADRGRLVIDRGLDRTPHPSRNAALEIAAKMHLAHVSARPRPDLKFG